MSIPITILFADDHALIRAGFQLMFKKSKTIKIVGEAKNGEEVIKMAHELLPDVIIMDINMPVMNGIDAAKRLTIELPQISILALSISNEDGQIIDMMEAGVKGYLLKNTDEPELSEAIKAVVAGGSYFCADTQPKLARIELGNQQPVISLLPMPVFSEKELLIIGLICNQFSSKQIAGKLNVGLRTIEWYRKKLFEKMDVKNAAGIVAYALTHKLVTIPE